MSGIEPDPFIFGRTGHVLVLVDFAVPRICVLEPADEEDRSGEDADRDGKGGDICAAGQPLQLGPDLWLGALRDRPQKLGVSQFARWPSP